MRVFAFCFVSFHFFVIFLQTEMGFFLRIISFLKKRVFNIVFRDLRKVYNVCTEAKLTFWYMSFNLNALLFL